jgi:hypothetical protein
MTTPGPSWQKALGSVRSFARTEKAERCELCSTELRSVHQHLIDPETRELICSCDGCSVLFDDSGITRYRRIPREVIALRGLELPDQAWERLRVPISLAFIYWSSHASKRVALYPSPVGVTEAVIEPEDWEPIARAHPALSGLRPDIEGLLINRLQGRRDYLLAPIDRCFELVGIVRTYWKGINGGDRIWQEVDRYWSRLGESAR